MATTICSLIITAMVITSIIEFAKPSYVGLVKKKYVATISIAIAFVLWIIAAFSIDFWLELEVGAKILLWLALGTWSTLWYDVWAVVQQFTEHKEEE